MHDTKTYENIIVFLMGFSGSGKLTIAEELIKHQHFKLADADTLHGPILRLANVDNYVPDEVWERVTPVRDAVLDTITNLSPSHFSFVFTYEMFNDYEYSIFLFNKIKNVVSIRESLFVPVRLICDEAELLSRVQNPERKKYYKTTDPERSKKQLENQSVFTSGLETEITINNTKLSAKQVVDKILQHIDQIMMR